MLAWWGGGAIPACGCLPCPDIADRVRELSGVSFIRAFTPCMRALPSRLSTSQSLSPNIITLGVKSSTYKICGNTHPQLCPGLHKQQSMQNFASLTTSGRASSMAQWVKNPLAMQDTQETWVWSLVGKVPWWRKWQPTLVFLPGGSHGQGSLTGYS